MKAFKLRSPAFGPGGEIPPKYTCDGSAVSPPLRWTEPPPGAQGLSASASSRRGSPARARWPEWEPRA